MDFQWSNIAFAIHILVEFPASLNFLLRPYDTLQRPQPHAKGVIRQYALLLMSSNLIATAFVTRPSDTLSGWIAGALALYHFGPLGRAISRIFRGEARPGLESPWVHAVVHAICLAALVMACLKNEHVLYWSPDGRLAFKIQN